GKHGLVIERDNARGLLLPGVAVENDWDSRRFLEQTCVKAGLHASLWKDDGTALFTFEGDSIRGPVRKADPLGTAPNRAPWYRPQDLRAFAEFCRQNIAALAVGATPNYYLPGVPDCTVSGVVLTVRWAGGTRERQFSQISMRPGIPLQSTL